VPGDLGAAVEHEQLRGAQQDTDPMADQPRRDRVVALPHDDPGVPVDPRGQQQPGLEHLGRQRPQQRLLEGEVLRDAQRPVADPTPIVGEVIGLEELVQLGHRLDLGDRDQVVAAEPAALTLDPALLMSALHAGVTVERIEAVVRPERDPAS